MLNASLDITIRAQRFRAAHVLTCMFEEAELDLPCLKRDEARVDTRALYRMNLYLSRHELQSPLIKRCRDIAREKAERAVVRNDVQLCSGHRNMLRPWRTAKVMGEIGADCDQSLVVVKSDWTESTGLPQESDLTSASAANASSAEGLISIPWFSRDLLVLFPLYCLRPLPSALAATSDVE